MATNFLDKAGALYLVTKTKTLLDTKVDKVAGKGLSANDYTDAEKAKLAAVEEGATKVIVDAALDLESTNAVQNKAIAASLGTKVDKVEGKALSSNDYTDAEKEKLAAVEAGANNYSLPTASTELGGVKTTSLVADATGYTPVPIIEGIPYYKNITFNDVSTEASGLMTPELLEKLNGVEEGATNVVVDTALASDSENAIQNKVVKAALDTKATIDSPAFTGVPTAATAAAGTNTTQVATTEFVTGAVATAVSSTYKAAGSTTMADLPAAEAATLGYVYNMTADFTTTDAFVEGSGKKYPAGTNIAVVLKDGSYVYDVLAGFIDTSKFALAADLVAVTNEEIDAMFNA